MNVVTRTAKADRCLHGRKHEEMTETLVSRHQEMKLNLNSRFYQKWVKIKLNSTAAAFPHPIKAPVIPSQCLKGTNLTPRDHII